MTCEFNREIDILKYFPDWLKEYEELKAIFDAENIMLNLVFDDIKETCKGLFIKDASEDFIEKYEEWWGIIPPEGYTLDDRRLAILAEINMQLPYTKRTLKRFLDSLVGENGYTMDIQYEKRHIEVRIELKYKNQLESIRKLLRNVLPANMTFNAEIRWNQLYMLSKFTIEELRKYTLQDLKESPDIKRIFLERGGVLI